MAGMRYFSRVPLWAAVSRALAARYPLCTATGSWDGLIIVLFAELTLFRPSGATRRDAARARIVSAQLFRDWKRLAHCSPALFYLDFGPSMGSKSSFSAPLRLPLGANTAGCRKHPARPPARPLYRSRALLLHHAKKGWGPRD